MICHMTYVCLCVCVCGCASFDVCTERDLELSQAVNLCGCLDLRPV